MGWKIKIPMLCVLWIAQQLMERGMMPDWIPRLSDDMLLMLFGGLVVWTIVALMPEAKRIIAIAWPWSRTSPARIAKLETELASLKELQEQLPASVLQEVHVHTAERRETVGDTSAGSGLTRTEFARKSKRLRET